MKKLLLVTLVLLLAVAACRLPATPEPATALPSPTPEPTPVAVEPTPAPTPIVLTPVPREALAPAPTPAAGPYIPERLLSLPDIVDRVKPGVVAILSQGVQTNLFLQPVPSQGVGSGVIFTPDGYILTNNHVVEDAQRITVDMPRSQQFPQGATYEGTVVGRDPLTDLAVVKVDARGLPTIPIGDTTKLRVGEWVIAIGNAQALPGGPTVTLGIVSALGRSVETGDRGIALHDLVQTDAAINPGNSGGPLLNLAGEVVGISTAIIRGAQNIGFAISTVTVRSVLDDLVQKGRVRWPWLGVRITTLTSALASEQGYAVDQGVLIIQVMPDYPAARGGLRDNDIMVSFNGVDTLDLETFQKLLRRYRAGDTVEIGVVRGKQRLTIKVTLAEMPAL